MTLVGIYVLIPCLFIPVIQRCIAFFKKDKRTEEWLWPYLWFLLPEKRKAAGIVVAMITLFFASVYIHQRIIWTGEDNANLNAKEYFVAGQPLNGIRQILCKYIHPENPTLLPLNLLQQLIYNQGVRYLPEDDGERGVWDDLWFYRYYIDGMKKPYGTNSYKPSHDMRRLLDRMYQSITIIATQPMADRQM